MAVDNNLIAVFSEDHAVRLTGVSHGQLRHWRASGFFVPSFGDDALREAFGYVYAFRDVVALRVLGSLRNQYGVSLQHLRQVKDRLQQPGPEAWTGVKLYVQNRKVIWWEPGSEMPQVVATGQYLIPTIEMDNIVSSTKSQVTALGERTAEQRGHIERRKMVNQNTAVLAGTRIPVRAIKRFHDAGYSVQGIIDEYPDLTESDINAAIAYEQAA